MVTVFTQERQYFHLLNAIRGVAAVLVVGRHTQHIADFPVSYMAVDIFFLLSGVVIEASYHHKIINGLTPWRFIWIRITRIYPLYILGTAITFTAYLLVGSHLTIGDISAPILHLFFAMLLLPSPFGGAPMFVFDHPAWSLFYELVVNVIYAFMVVKLTSRRLTMIIIFFGAALLSNLAYFAPQHMTELGWQGPKTYFGGFARAAFSFFVGVGLCRLNSITNMEFIRSNSGIATCVVLAVVILSLMAPAVHQLTFYVFCVFLLFPVIVFVALSVKSSASIQKIWDFLGDISYAIYALHVPIFVFISSFLIVFSENYNFTHKLLVKLIYIASLLIFSYVADKTFDRSARNILRELHWPWGRVVETEPRN